MYRILRINENLTSPFISFIYKGNKIIIDGETPTKVYNYFLNWLDDNGYSFPPNVHNTKTRKVYSIGELDEMNLDITKFHNINNKNFFIPNSSLFLSGNVEKKLRNMSLMLKEFGVDTKTIESQGFIGKTKDLFSKNEEDLDDEDLDTHKGDIIPYEDELLEDEDDLVDDGDEEDEKVPSFRESLLLEFWTIFRSEISKSTNLFNRRTPRPKIYYGSSTGLSKISFFCVASTRYARVEIYFNKKNPDENKELFDYFLSRKDELENNFGDKLIFERLDNRRASRIKYEVPTDVYEQNNWPKIIDFLKTNFLKLVETFQPIINEIVSDPSIVKSRIIPASVAISKKEKPITYVKNPFGCKQENGDETSTLCILGKSGTGKTTTTEEVLESMGHECLLYIPIEGEYTFSQYTGKKFEMSSLGEFVMRAQNDPSICYTVIFDECHRPITISKLNTDLLQALSSRRNRGGERFFTMDRSTKRMYITPTEEFPIALKEKSGKILVPDNFGIVCLSSQPAVICRNEDFLNRVDIAIFTQNDRNIKDLNQLIKLESGQKNIETIRGLLVSDGREQ